MALDVGSLELYMGPTELGASDNLEETIIQFLNDAKEELYLAIQELESEPIARAVIAARQRGLRVRVILEKGYITEDKALTDPWTEGGDHAKNREIFLALQRARVDVNIDLNPKIFHQKFVVRDPEDSRAAVLCGSANFTPTGMHQNLNHIIIMRGKRMARYYLEEFDENWTGTFGTKQERHDGGPKRYEVANVKIRAAFAPDHTPELEIVKQMLKAEERIDFAIFTFSQSSGIDDAMICLHKAGIPVRGVLDRGQGNQKWAATRPLKNAGAELWRPKKYSDVRKVHHKLMVIDREIVIAGSFNFTGPANRLNDENILVIGDKTDPDPDTREKQQQIGEYVLNEIDRIITTYCEEVPEFDD